MVRISMKSKDVKRKVLEKARKLNQDKENPIYINPERTFLDRKEFHRMRLLAKDLKGKYPDKEIYIKKGVLYFDGMEFDRENPMQYILNEQSE